MTDSGTVNAPRPVTPLSILATKLERIGAQLDCCEGVGAEVKAELQDARELASGLDPYIGHCTTPESPALAELARLTREEPWDRWPQVTLEQEMLTGHVEGQLLKFLVRMCRARHVLDLGMFTGYSALAMAEALPDDGRVVACEVDANVAVFAQRCFEASPSGRKITTRIGPAAATLERLAADGESFDLVFVDADKASYTGYVTRLLDSDLLAADGLICADNTLMQGEPYSSGAPSSNGRAIAAFNQAMVDDARVVQVLLPLRDGLTLIRRA